jgi:hypothetical protein
LEANTCAAGSSFLATTTYLGKLNTTVDTVVEFR